MRYIFTILLLANCPLFAEQRPVDEQKVKAQVSEEARVELEFRSPPGAALTFKAVDTGESQGRKLVRYSVSVTGPIKSGRYILMTWDIGTKAPVIALRDVKVDDSGTIRCGDKAGDCPAALPGANIVLGFTGMMGQPRRLVLTGSNKMPVAMGEVIPFPASATDRSCTIEAVLLRPNGSAVLVIGKGFRPNEVVKFASSSYEESVGSAHAASSTGVVMTLVLPFVKGHDEGKTAVTLLGSECSPSTAFRWGAYQEEPAQTVPDK